MIKLIASDIDGTLIPEGANKLDEELFDIIRQLKKQGILFAAASGRHYSSIVKLFAPVKDDIVFISGNGANVYYQDQMLVQHIIEPKYVSDWIKLARKAENANFVIDTKEVLYTESKDPGFLDWMKNGYRNDVVQVEDVLAVQRNYTKLAIFRKENFEALTKQMMPPFEKDLYCVVSGSGWIDFMVPGTNKGNAVKELQRRFHVTADETMVFGDNDNDLEMIQSATGSYAPRNATESVRNAARYLADSNEEQGVLKVLRTLVKA